MAQYKVPQDVEADDKLLGPFNFRQFIYLLIAAGLIALAWALAQLSEIFILLSVVLVLPALFLLVLALPLRKDQPMETYVAALISYYTKPNRRLWNPGQRESTITIYAPKTVEKKLIRDLSEEEAGRRLSFLASVVDSEGNSLKGGATPSDSPVRGEILAEANAITDVFDNYRSTQIGAGVMSESDRRHAEAVEKMRAAIDANNPINPTPAPSPTPVFAPPVNLYAPTPAPTPPLPPRVAENLSTNDAYTVSTIAQQAARTTRIKPKKKDKEVYISLH
ncbi:PrgI family protein [Candidatus Saccharibacteria bacterium]|nr:PrgI family protein [Candidatus Saccharibacteria bacterium]